MKKLSALFLLLCLHTSCLGRSMDSPHSNYKAYSDYDDDNLTDNNNDTLKFKQDWEQDYLDEGE